jgi:gluconate 2-dehydrogenase subunit 3-like protein
MADRREALKIIGAIGSTCAFPFSADELYGQHAHPAQAEAALPAPRHFAAGDFKTVSRIADLIIPPTDTPGAIAAGVPQYIDMVVGSSQQHQQTFREGLARIESAARDRFGKAFIELTESQQVELLTPLSIAEDKFFEAIKGMTADGYYTSRIGLTQELGFTGGAVLAQFPDCTHEH